MPDVKSLSAGSMGFLSESFTTPIKDYGTKVSELVVKTPAFECLLPCERSPVLEDCIITNVSSY